MQGPFRQIARCGVLILALGAGQLASRAAGEQSDDEFIAALGDESISTPVDRKRLARILFSQAATLDGGKSGVQLLHAGVNAPDSSLQAVTSLLRTRYEAYVGSLARFKSSVTALLDEPQSLLLLYRTMVDGQRTCWHFDLHNRLIDIYGSGGGMLSILASREACSRLQTATFQPRVDAIIRAALVEHVYQREEIVALQLDIADLERLLADLREIDGSE